MKTLKHKLAGKRTYLDSNIIIYALEGFEVYSVILSNFFNLVDHEFIEIVTSQLSLAECLVKPYAEKREDIIKIYREFIRTSNTLKVQELTENILIDSAKIRAKEKELKLPDAIHIATALFRNCSLFLTNDKRIKSSVIDIIYLDDLK